MLGEKAIQDGLNLMSCPFKVNHFHVLSPLKMLMSLLLHDWLLHVKLCDPVDSLFPLTKLKYCIFWVWDSMGWTKHYQGNNDRKGGIQKKTITINNSWERGFRSEPNPQRSISGTDFQSEMPGRLSDLQKITCWIQVLVSYKVTCLWNLERSGNFLGICKLERVEIH